MMAMMVVTLVSVNFTSCSSDDDDVSSTELEGVWGLVHSEGYDYEDPSEPLEWNEDFNPLSPGTDDLKVEIINTNGNTYLFNQYYWSSYSKVWRLQENYKATLNGKTLTTEDGDKVTILTLNSTQLVIEAKSEKRYVKQTLRKLSSI